MARRVRHLRLKADSREAVGRVLPGLEDALRTATLPDDGGRLLLVRRIALGRIAADAAPASLALALERAVAAARIDCRPAESATAAGAAAVWFRDALHAHVALALRLLEGPPPVEWFWPLAVPAWSPGCSGAAALRVLAASLAALPEGPAALPAWRAALRARGHGPAVAGEPGTAATVAARRSPVVAPGPAARLAAAPVRTTEARPELADDPAAAAATVLIVATPASPGPGRAEAAPARPAAPEPLPADRRSAPPAPGASAINEPHRRAAAAALPAAPAGPAAWSPTPTTRAAPATADDRDPDVPNPDPGPSAAAAASPIERSRLALAALEQAPFDGLPTAAGGIGFVLPVLARLGFRPWLEAAPDGIAQRLVAGVFGALLARLDIAADDPAWALAAAPAAGRGARPPVTVAPLPASWAGLGRRDGRRPLCIDIDPDADPLEVQLVALWSRAVHRWLRRRARLGLGALIRRPARLALTPTHLDLRFDLAAVDLRVRRAGLDVDPGWLPWYGRVVGFHYERQPL